MNFFDGAWLRRSKAGSAAIAAFVATILSGAGAAMAATIEGAPRDWQLGFQRPGSESMEMLESFHNHMLLPITTAISVFVLLLLIIVIVRFNKGANPVPSKNAHNTLIEVLWTVVPVMILVAIAIPSFRLLFFEARLPAADVTLKATGNTWNWDYEYPDLGDIQFKAVMVPPDQLKPGQPKLLTTDNKVVVPVGKVIRVQTTANDVIHSWAVPAFGVKMDAMPGRLNETWFKAEREGIYYGQCSELCGTDHAFMPIEVHVVSEDLFKQWVEAAKSDVDKANQVLAAAEGSPLTFAAATPAGSAQ